MRLSQSFFLIALLCTAIGAGAETQLDVDIGWGGGTRTGRWLPIFITASDPRPHNVVLEVYWPHDSTYATRISQGFTIGPDPATFPLIVPINYAAIDASITLRDASNGKTLAHLVPSEANSSASSFFAVSMNSRLIGVSGQPASLRFLNDQLSGNQRVNIGFLDTRFLPTAPMGLDGLDLLVLNQPNLNSVSAPGSHSIGIDAQQAIVDWVRAGGTMLLWPGDAVLPDSSPLLDALPCSIGERYNLELSQEARKRLGFSDRFAKLPARRLIARPGTSAEAIFGDGFPVAVVGPLGLGRIVVAPMPLTELQFSDNAAAEAFWKPVLLATGFTWVTEKTNEYYPAQGSDLQREQAAATSLADQLGDVPGAGQFGFSYVAIVLIAMMIIVGPVDWIVLKMLGRQPWTWVTTSGWITLLTLGALYAGHMFKSGDLYFRTAQLVDQVDDHTVASVEMTAIYSPRTARYVMQSPDDTWWQPAGIDPYYGRGGGPMKIDLGFHQTWQGNTPEPLWINVWNLRFLRGDRVGAGPPILTASLKLTGDSRPRLVGTIRNLTDRPLADFRVVTRNGEGTLARVPDTLPSFQPADVREIAPGDVASVEATLAPSTPTNDLPGKYPGWATGTHPVDPIEMYWLAPRRTRLINEMMSTRDGLVCVYARVVNPSATVTLSPGGAIEEHTKWVRALVTLETGGTGAH